MGRKEMDAAQKNPIVATPSAYGYPLLVKQLLLNALSLYAVPEHERIAFVAEIPKTSVGKVNKKALRERAG
jgi:non-ribosomal peptide synthetase component E (peptide arylation enzyme)